MGVRIRKDDKTIVCSAESRKRKGDTYIDHYLHYLLVTKFKVLHTDNDGATWYFGVKKRGKAERATKHNKRKPGSQSRGK